MSYLGTREQRIRITKMQQEMEMANQRFSLDLEKLRLEFDKHTLEIRKAYTQRLIGVAALGGAIGSLLTYLAAHH